MSEFVYDTWGGLTLGDNGTDPVTYGLIRTGGLEDIAFDGDPIQGSFDGEASTAMRAVSRSWTTELDLAQGPGAARQTLLNNLRTATASAAEGEYVIYDRDTVYTIFAHVVKRSLPRDADMIERGYGEGSVTFGAYDPVIYGPENEDTFDAETGELVVTSDGWVGSERWTWVVDGPATNPQIASTVGDTAIIRYVGSVASGHHLVVELLPKGQIPGYRAKVVTTAQLPNYRTVGVGTNVYGAMDGGSAGARIPQWFPVVPGAQTVTYSATSGAGESRFTWRAGFN